MAVTTEVYALGLLAFCWTVVSLVAQDTGCSSLKTPFVVSNLGNLSVGIADIGYLRDYALRPLLAQPRVSGTYGSDVARTHIKTWMSAAGWTVKEDSFYDYTPYGSRRFSNVIATLSPGKSRRVVLACHYDSKLMPTVRFVGAIDSAVPCSLLMDSAFRLRGFLNTSISSSSDLTLQFIFFDGEEAFVTWTQQDSLYGARHLASKWASTPDPGTQGLDNYLRSIETFILLDLIGTPDTHFKMRFQQTAPVYYQLQSIESCLRDSGHLTPTQYPGPLFTSQRDFSVIEDDHIPFWQRRVPIVHLITSPFPSVWHTARDNLQALDFNRIDNLARVLRVFLMNLPLW